MTKVTAMIRRVWKNLTAYVDGPLLGGVMLLVFTGLLTLYSASDGSWRGFSPRLSISALPWRLCGWWPTFPRNA